MSALEQKLEQILKENEKLKTSNGILTAQVRKLIQTESSLYQFQEKLDAQMKIYRRLHELGNTLSQITNVDEMLKEMLRFLDDEINFEKNLIFVKIENNLFCKYCSGDEETVGSALSKTLPRVFLEKLNSENEYFFHFNDPVGEIESFLVEMGLCEFMALPMWGNSKSDLRLVVVCGNSRERRDFYSRLKRENHFHVGVANLINQINIAIKNIENYSALLEERKLLEVKITERTEDLTHAYNEMKKLDELKSQFFANISHELRTPLTLALGPVELIKSDLQSHLSEDSKKHLDVIYKNLIRLYAQINEFLDFSKLEAKKMQLNVSQVDIVSALNVCIETLSSALIRKNISFKFDNDFDELVLYLDIKKFERIVMNLLSNAFKFTPEGGYIGVRLHALGSQKVQLVIEDTGIGISKDQQEKIFQRFSQADSSETREYEGTGIGLAMVKEYVELHHGQIEVSSDLGKGTSMSISFNLGKDHFVNDEISESKKEINQGSLNMTLVKDFIYESDSDLTDDNSIDKNIYNVQNLNGTILLVEDNAELRQYIKSLLEQKYFVVSASDGKTAWEKMKHIKPDLILSDMMMPKMSGSELCEKVKKHKDYRHIPFVLLTAKSDQDLKLIMLKLGADDYLNKPFNPAELNARIDNLIKLKKYQNSLHQLNDELQVANEFIKDQQSSLVKSEKLNVLNELIAGISHEMSSPLLAITAGLSWYQKYINRLESFCRQIGINDNQLLIEPKKLQKKFSMMNSSVKKMRGHINKLKSFVRFQDKDANDFNLNEECDISLHVMDYLRPAHVCFETNYGNDLPMVVGNPAEINQLISNILKNAIESIPNSREGLIIIKTEFYDNKVTLKIKDNGIGITPDIQNKLFKEICSSTSEKAGVGLYLCRSIVKNNDIEIKVKSEVEVGSEFILKFNNLIKND